MGFVSLLKILTESESQESETAPFSSHFAFDSAAYFIINLSPLYSRGQKNQPIAMPVLRPTEYVRLQQSSFY